MEVMVVTQGVPGVDGQRPNVMVVMADDERRHDDVVSFACCAQGGNWRVGVLGDLPGDWVRSNPVREGGKLLWYLVRAVSDPLGI